MALIIGNSSTANTNAGLSLGFVIVQRFQAIATGNVVNIRYRASGSGNVIVGMYSDNAGNPNALLNQSGSQAVVAGENILTIPSTAIVNGTFYWLAYDQDTNSLDAMDQSSSGKNVQYVSTSFGSAWPNPYGTPTGSSTTWNLNVGGLSADQQSNLPNLGVG